MIYLILKQIYVSLLTSWQFHTAPGQRSIWATIANAAEEMGKTFEESPIYPKSMASGDTLGTWLVGIAPKFLLQKALLSSGPADLARPAKSEAIMPLSELRSTDTVTLQYESAIAHVLAAQYRKPATALATELAPQITKACAQLPLTVVATGLVAQATPVGWLTLTLSPAGVDAWRQQWQQYPSPRAIAEGHGIPVEPESSRSWPLCDRLRLSLPLLLQWAHTRCYSWRQHWSDSSALPTAIAAPTPRTAVASVPSDCVSATRPLLLTVMSGLDRLAARSGDPSTCQQVGYQVAQRIYDLEATRTQWQPPVAHRPALNAMVPDIAAAQKLLALLLAVGFNTSACFRL